MRSPTAQILETALALHRTPGERFRLRERPLPEGIIHILEIASGSPPAVAAAAAETGEDAPDIVEASRFYLEQVLFAAEGADAYRILGVAPDAAQDTIRLHHRWLQRWLHPDRAQAGDATVFATRVNQAWAQLRTPDLRHDYDVRLAEARLAGADAPLPAKTLHRWEQVDLPPRHGGRSRWLLAAALVACAVLAVLVFRHQETIAPWEQHDASQVATSAPSPQMDDSDVGILAAALRIDPAPPVSVGAAEAATQTLPAPPTPSQYVGAAEAAIPLPRLIAASTAPTATAPTATAPTAAVPMAVVPVAAAPAVVAPAVIAASAAPTAAAPTAAVPTAAPMDPRVVVERMRQAEKRVAQVTAYLAARPGAAPLWNDPQAKAAALQARARIRPHQGARLELIQPQWRLQRDSASVSAGYTVRSDGGAGRGRLDVQLVWREGLWLVRGVELAPAA